MFPVLFNPSHGGSALLRITSWYPVHFARSLQSAISGRRLRIAIRRIQRLPEGAVPDRALLTRLRDGWGNKGFAATLDYLEHTARLAARTEGPVLECGSGLTTLLLGLLAGRRGVPIITLEHHAKWRDHVADALERYRIPGVNIIHVPLRDFGDYQWYSINGAGPMTTVAPPAASAGSAAGLQPGIPAALLPRDVQLVICDGPPGFTPGGRYGLMPLVGDRLARECTILLDDSERKGEKKVIDRWEGDPLLSGRVWSLNRRQGFAEIILA